MYKIIAETFAKSYVHNIIDKEKNALAEKQRHRRKSQVENIYDLIDQEIKDKFETRNWKNEQIREYKRHWSELNDDEKFMYTREDIIMNIIICCRVSIPEAVEFRSKLGFKRRDVILIKEQSVISKITKLF